MYPYKHILRCLAGILALWSWTASTHAAETLEQLSYTLSGPYTHKNLQIFLVHAKPQVPKHRYMILTEALKKKVVVVHETSNVQQLAIENVSADVDVYIQSGDIVKGGKQDRVIRMDVIVPPKSGKLPLASFCVERGRWAQRGKESSKEFVMNAALVPDRRLRLATKYQNSQGAVWSNVDVAQNKLNANLRRMTGKQAIEVRAKGYSPTSLQLTLENKDLKKVAGQYKEKLGSIIAGKPDVVGFVFAINGEVNNADIYGNARLFQDMWPKLLEATVTEAITEYQKPDGKIRAAMKAAQKGVASLFAEVAKGKLSSRDVTKRTRLMNQDTKDFVLFETRDQARGGRWVHRNYIKKDPNMPKAPPPSRQIQLNRLNDAPLQQRLEPNQLQQPTLPNTDGTPIPQQQQRDNR